MIKRRTLIAAFAAALVFPALSQQVDNQYRVARLVTRIEADYTPRGRKPTPPVDAQPIGNPARVPYPFGFLSTLDLQIAESKKTPPDLLVLSFHAVDEFLAGRGDPNLDSFEYLVSFTIAREFHQSVAAQFRQTDCEAAQVALLGMLRWASFAADTSRLLAEALGHGSLRVRRAALLSLAPRGRVDQRQPEYDIETILTAIRGLIRTKTVAITDVQLLLALLGEKPFSEEVRSNALSKEILNRIQDSAHSDQVVAYYAAKLRK